MSTDMAADEPTETRQTQQQEEGATQSDSRVLLLVQHSSVADIHGLRELSPDVNTEVQLKYYGDAADDDAWFKQYIVAGQDSEVAMANAIFASINANTASFTSRVDVTIPMVMATFMRLLRFYNKQIRPLQMAATAQMFTLMHFITNGFAQHVRQMIEDAAHAESEQTTPQWFKYLTNPLPMSETPWPVFTQFYLTHRQTIDMPLPPNFAVRLLHFTLCREQYECAIVMLTSPAFLMSLPMATSSYLAKHLSTRLDFTQALQEKQPGQVHKFIEPEEIEKLKQQLASAEMSTFWPAMALLGEWQTRNEQAKRNAVRKTALYAIENPNERLAVASQIVSDENTTRVEQARSAMAKLSEDQNFLVKARERIVDRLADAQRTLDFSMDALGPDNEETKRDPRYLAMATLRGKIQETLDFDATWMKDVFSSDPLPLQGSEIERVAFIAAAEKQAVDVMYKQIAIARSRVRDASARLTEAYELQRRAQLLSDEQRMQLLQAELSGVDAKDYFGED